MISATPPGTTLVFVLWSPLPTEGRDLRALMPISTRPDDQHGATLGNKLTTLFVDLPIEPMEPEVVPGPFAACGRAVRDVSGRLRGRGSVATFWRS